MIQEGEQQTGAVAEASGHGPFADGGRGGDGFRGELRRAVLGCQPGRGLQQARPIADRVGPQSGFSVERGQR
jgi:hypothetical protein